MRRITSFIRDTTKKQPFHRAYTARSPPQFFIAPPRHCVIISAPFCLDPALPVRVSSVFHPWLLPAAFFVCFVPSWFLPTLPSACFCPSIFLSYGCLIFGIAFRDYSAFFVAFVSFCSNFIPL